MKSILATILTVCLLFESSAKAGTVTLWLFDEPVRLPVAQAVKLCVRHGVKVIYHANFADEEALDMLEENKDKLFVARTSVLR